MNKTKYIIVTGGVLSSLGKGITAASLGRLLKARGLKVTIQKFDPYINIDPGTMSPYQHGEVFVTDDGAETDLDLGHYERFIDENLNKYSSITMGKIYQSVLMKERRGEYLGSTVQVIPHITDEIKQNIYNVSGDYDVVIIEIGGTVGDIESLPFIEAMRQFGNEIGKDNIMYVHLAYIPYLNMSGEIKTKPTQHSIHELRAEGVQPDILVCRTEKELSDEIKNKLSLFCNVSKDCIIQNLDASSIYEVPLMLEKEKLAQLVCKHFKFENIDNPDLLDWEKIAVKDTNKYLKEVTIALVGKYVELHDAYLSVAEALRHGGFANDVKVNIEWINSEYLNEDNVNSKLSISSNMKKINGIVIPGGFGKRGINGKILAAKYARENKIPFLGLCLGMQIATIEFSRNVCGLSDADSTELNEKTSNPVIDIMVDQDLNQLGGTMRLGSYECELYPDTHAYNLYLKDKQKSDECIINERHRHRYEFNNNYKNILQENGLIIAGVNPQRNLVEIIELKDHPFFVGVQFHPELKSRPNKPHPLFIGLINAAKNN